MKVKQISIFLENRVGRLSEIIKKVADNRINMVAISLADTSDFGILRLLVEDVDRAAELLRAGGVVCRTDDVTVVEVDASAGGLAKVMEVLDGVNVNIEYMYAVSQYTNPKPLMVMRFSERETARQALRDAGVHIFDEI